ncbi:MAG: hypothetical protein ACLQU2_33750 [Candidatus Binataceae bacterium]
MFSVLRRLAALAGSSGPTLKVLTIILAIAALPVQPDSSAVVSILTPLSPVLAPIGHQFQGRCANQWSARTTLGKDWQNREIGPPQPAGTGDETIAMRARMPALARCTTRSPLSTASAGRAPPIF